MPVRAWFDLPQQAGDRFEGCRSKWRMERIGDPDLKKSQLPRFQAGPL